MQKMTAQNSLQDILRSGFKKAFIVAIITALIGSILSAILTLKIQREKLEDEIVTLNDRFVTDLTTSYTFKDYDGLGYQIQHIYGQLPMQCLFLKTIEGKIFDSHQNDQCKFEGKFDGSILVESGGIQVGTLFYKFWTVNELWQVLQDKFLIFGLLVVAITIAWIPIYKTIGKNIRVPLASFTNSLLEEQVPHRNEEYCLEFNLLQEAIFKSAETLKTNEKLSAIANTIQMLAHDVRKPFSMLKTGLNMLQVSANDPIKFKTNLKFLVSEVERASQSVDGMLTDVMEIGSTSTELIQEPIAPEALLESTLGEVFRVYPQSKIAINYELKHSAMVNVHLKKVSRIFSNIVGNAVQAMDFSGSLWFKTKTEGEFVQFCIGNSGSLIPPESLTKLFEAFFTSGKKGGTGLGLAIAQKLVQAHGGKIWCESSRSPEYPEGKVEFFFTLPTVPGVDLVTTANLPKHSDEITQMIAMMGMGQASGSSSDSELNKSEGILHQEVVMRAKTLQRSLGILIVDDESIYRNSLAGWIEESPELAQLCHIYHANGSVEAFDAIKLHSIDLIITDIDMGPKSLCGFDLVKEITTNQHDNAFKSLIFVHSNRIVTDDHRRAGDLGAHGFLPKPMSKGQLFKLLLQTIHWLCPLKDSSTIAGPTLETVAQVNKSSTNLIAIIDDEDIFRDQWPVFLRGFDTVCYKTAEDFVNDWEQIGGRLLAVLTDKYLGSGIDGLKLGAILRKKAPDLVIILSTSDMSVKDGSNVFDLIVDKDAFEEAPKIIQYLQTKINDEDLPAMMRRTMRSFDGQAQALGEKADVAAIIDDHISSWEFVLKDLDHATKVQLGRSMAELGQDRLKHDINGSITRFKILLRIHDEGEVNQSAILTSLHARVADLAKL